VANAYQIAMLMRLMNDRQFLEAEKKFTGMFSRSAGSRAGEKK
jgi:hypothetical protein